MSIHKATRLGRPRLEDLLLFACARQDFTESHKQFVHDISLKEEVSWRDLYQTAFLHGVAPLIFTNLQRCSLDCLNLPESIIEKFTQCTKNTVVVKQKRASILAKLLAYADHASIDIMLIKGAALDILVYEQIWYTTSSDVDLVIRQSKEKISPEVVYDLEAIKEGFHFEYDFFEHHDVTINNVIPVNFKRIWEDAIEYQYMGHVVYGMSPEDMLISLCINSCRKRFFRLKSLLDIAETITQYRLMNSDRLVEKAREYRCNNIVHTALYITERTLGCDLPTGLLRSLADSSFRAGVIQNLAKFVKLDNLGRGKMVFGRELSPSLLLSYSTLFSDQIRRKLGYFWSNRTRPLGLID